MRHDTIREKGLANFESLLALWGVEFKKLTENEYDFLSPTRCDRNFGACRFNTYKGRGADFASSTITDGDCRLLGAGFTKNDFVGFTNGKAQKSGFDIIGLVQRVHNCNTYQEGIRYLNDDLNKIKANGGIITPPRDAAEKRRLELEAQQQKRIEISQRVWHTAKDYKGTPAEKYFKNRGGLVAQESNIRFTYLNHVSGVKYPTILFKVQKTPDSNIVAIHRIFITEDGTKAPVDDPKMALGAIKGAGIWFGTPNDVLFVVEGPENALVYRYLDRPFVVSTVYANNYHNLIIPSYVKTVILAPDEDKAGLSAARLAANTYRLQHKKIKMVRVDG